MSTLTFIDPFVSIPSLCTFLQIPQSRLTLGYRLVTPRHSGHINALPESRGLLVATDGIVAVIYRSDRSVYFGHYQWWIPDDVEEFELSKAGDKVVEATATAKKRQRVFAEFDF